MLRFKNILVGVDLSRRDRLVSKKLNRHSSMVYDSALALSKLSGARLHFLYGLEVSVETQRRIQRDRGLSPTLLDIAEDRMKRLVEDAKGEGVEASGNVVLGRSWLAIIREVLGGNYDLVMVGTRKLGTLKSALLGSIGIQLLRKCPCPVWISKTPLEGALNSILLANDHTPVGEEATLLAASLAELNSAELHVLHSLAGYSSPGVQAQLSAEDVVEAKEKISIQLSDAGLTRRARVQLASESSFCTAVSDHVHHHTNELLILGTQAYSGITRMIKRERAERLLSRVPCSLLALKPKGFASSVSLSDLDDPTASVGAA
jgi:nucleotide-binding universal stress UspA family protein